MNKRHLVAAIGAAAYAQGRIDGLLAGDMEQTAARQMRSQLMRQRQRRDRQEFLFGRALIRALETEHRNTPEIPDTSLPGASKFVKTALADWKEGE